MREVGRFPAFLRCWNYINASFFDGTANFITEYLLDEVNWQKCGQKYCELRKSSFFYDKFVIYYRRMGYGSRWCHVVGVSWGRNRGGAI